jgi:hypothetical protein
MWHFTFAVVDHSIANKQCRELMAAAYQLNKETDGHPTEEDMQKLQQKRDEDVKKSATSGEAPGNGNTGRPKRKQSESAKVGAKKNLSKMAKAEVKGQKKITDFKRSR